MKAYGTYRLLFSGVRDNSFCSFIQMREEFGGADVIAGGTASGNEIFGGTADSPLDGDMATYMWQRLNLNDTYWEYVFPAAVSIREYALAFNSGEYPSNVSLVAWDGAAWVTLDVRAGLVFSSQVVETFSLYEIAGVAKFSDGVVAAGGFINRSAGGAKVGDISPDVSGNFSSLTQDPGPYDLLIFRSGYRPLVQVEKLAGEA